jgi:hypothetical protein
MKNHGKSYFPINLPCKIMYSMVFHPKTSGICSLTHSLARGPDPSRAGRGGLGIVPTTARHGAGEHDAGATRSLGAVTGCGLAMSY